MFKNLTLYRYTLPEAIGLEQIEQALQAVPFTPCTATQDKAVGFVPARGEEHGALVESVAGQWIAKLMIETKSVPASAIKKKAQAEADHIEATTGRKPGKKEMKALREDALLALLPAAFPRQAVAWIWFNQATGLLAIDASSQGKLDEAITALVRAIDSLAITPLHTRVGPQAAMARWLCALDTETDWPESFAIERACELRSIDEEKAVVKFKNHHLMTDEVRQHITEGKLPRSVAMSWEGRLGFVLTEAMHIKQLTYLDGVFDGQRDDKEAGFDTDVAIATGELNNMVPALIEALGGELQVGKEGGTA